MKVNGFLFHMIPNLASLLLVVIRCDLRNLQLHKKLYIYLHITEKGEVSCMNLFLVSLGRELNQLSDDI